jgi:hypothetical protein
MWAGCGFFCAGPFEAWEQRFGLVNSSSQTLEDSTAKAIGFKIGHEFNQLTDMIHRYIVGQSSVANSRALALHRGYQHLKSDLVPEMEARIVTYCLDVGVRDENLITAKIKGPFESQLSALGQSLGVNYQTAATVGTTMHAVLQFKGWVTAYCAGISSRVFVAVAQRRHMDTLPSSAAPRAPTLDPTPGDHTISVNQSGGVTAQNYVVNNYPAAPSESSPKDDATEERRFQKSHRLAKAGFLVAIICGLVAFAAWRWPREPVKRPPPSVAPPKVFYAPSPPTTPPAVIPGSSVTSPRVNEISQERKKGSPKKGKSMLDRKTGDTVISINQSGGVTAHTVIQNNTRRTIRKAVHAEWGTRDATGKQVLRLVFQQTDGIWEPGTRFWLQVDLSGPYEHAEIQGFPRALFEAGMTEGASPAAAQGKFEFTTITPPIAGQDIVLEVESAGRLEVRGIRLSPSEGQ